MRGKDPDAAQGEVRKTYSVRRGVGLATGQGSLLWPSAVSRLQEETVVVGPDRAILYANEPVLRRLGLSLAELVGQPCCRVFLGDQLYCLMPRGSCPVALALSTGKPAAVTHGKHGDPILPHCIEKEAIPLRDADGRIAAVLCLPVEAPLAELDIYHHVFASMRDGVAIISHDGNFVEANTAFCGMLGYTKAELAAMTVTDFVALRLARALRDSARRGIPFVELSLKRKDDSKLSVEVAVSPLPVARSAFYVATVRDITPRREWEDIVGEQAQELTQYQAIFEASGVALAVIEDDTTISMVNHRFEEMTGYRREEVGGRMSMLDFVAEEDREQALTMHRMRRDKPGEVLPHHHNWITCKTGERWLASVNGAMIPGTRRSVIALRDRTDSFRMQEEVLRRNQELETLYSVASMVSRSTDLDGMLKQVLEKVLELTGLSRGLIYLLEEGHKELQIKAFRTVSDTFLKAVDNLALGEGFGGRVAQTGESAFVPDISGDPRLTRRVALKEGFRALACVPLISGRKIRGVMTVSGHEVRDFSPEEQRLLVSIGHEIGVALERAEFIQKAQDRARELGTLMFVTRQLTSTLDLQQVLDRTLVIMCMQVGADHGGVVLADEEAGCMVARSVWGEDGIPLGTRWKPGQGVVGWVTHRCTEFVTGDIATDPRVSGAYGPQFGFRSMAGVPLKVKDKLLGAIVVANKEEDAFTSDHLRFLSAYASQAALAIENALLFESSRKEASNLAEALRQLSTSEHRFRMLAATTSNGLIERGREGNLVRANQVLLDMVGYSLEELAGCDLCFFVAPASIDKVRAEASKRFQGAASTYEAELETKDGQIVPVLISGTPLRDQEGNVVGHLAAVTDLRQVRKLQQERAKNEKLATIGKMASVVAHEVRNPLGAVSNSLFYIKMRLGDADVDPKVMRHLEIISKAVASISDITEELLDCARPKTPALRECSLNSIMEEAIAQVAFPQDVSLVSELQTDLPPVSGDPEMIRRVLVNLLLNAIQAMPEGGGIVTARTRTAGDFQEVLVSDTGMGIESAVIGQLFQPFFTTKARGAGLGLYASKEIVEAHGGTLDLRSQVDRGTMAVVSLPFSTKNEASGDV